MVRLRVSCNPFKYIYIILFQFQYGAIKSVVPVIALSPNHKFQFQYGAIKRFIHPCGAIVFLDFNSSMVRLRGGTVVYAFSNNGNFNSSMVRLRVIGYSDGHEVYREFQFQYGAIKRPFAPVF